MEVIDWTVSAGLVCLILVLLYVYGTWTFSTFSKRGILGPAPVPFFGNTLEVWRKGIFQVSRDLPRQYGKNTGFFFMRDPVLFTTDLNIVKEVFVKDFTNFTNRAKAPRINPPYPINLSLAFAEDDTWRRLRHTMTPTFSTGKLKLMDPFISRCCDSLLSHLLRLTEKGELIDVKRAFGAYTIDVIAGTAFGLQTDFLTNENDAFVQAAMKLIRKSSVFGLRDAVFLLFPSLARLCSALGLTDSAGRDLSRLIENLIDDRKQNNKRGGVDFLQLMLDAEASDAEVAAKPQDKQMTRTEIISQGVSILLGGYETTATTLNYMTYLLALNPNKQEKLYNEIVAAIGNAPPSYEKVMNIKYLDNTIWETLRYFPPAVMTSRGAAEARTINGIHIPAGGSVVVPIYAIMKDEEIFPEPDKFIPERFEDGIPTLVRELTFGAGPRQCIGMRLALYEAKMAAVTVIRKFKFVTVPDTPEFISFDKLSVLSSPVKPIFVRAEVRS